MNESRLKLLALHIHVDCCGLSVLSRFSRLIWNWHGGALKFRTRGSLFGPLFSALCQAETRALHCYYCVPNLNECKNDLSLINVESESYMATLMGIGVACREWECAVVEKEGKQAHNRHIGSTGRDGWLGSSPNHHPPHTLWLPLHTLKLYAHFHMHFVSSHHCNEMTLSPFLFFPFLLHFLIIPSPPKPTTTNPLPFPLSPISF